MGTDDIAGDDTGDDGLDGQSAEEQWWRRFYDAQAIRDRAAQTRAFRDLAERADADHDIGRGFEARLAQIEASRLASVDIPELAAFAWCQARIDDEPDQFHDGQRERLGWVHKWMPGAANSRHQVPKDRIRALLDGLEARHVAEGAGRRQAIAVGIHIARADGDLEAVRTGLAAWRDSARSSLSDCEACEIALEAASLAQLGEPHEALAVAAPLIDGQVEHCGAGPGFLASVAIPLLIEAGRGDDAARLFRSAMRSEATRSSDRRDVMGSLAASVARAGDAEGALPLVVDLLNGVTATPSDSARMRAAAGAARALDSLDPDTPVPVGVDLPDGVGSPPADGWTAGPLSRALANAALSVAARFDARNGTDGVTLSIQGDLAEPDLPPVALVPGRAAVLERAAQRSNPVAPSSGPDDRAEGAAAPSTPLDPAPDDALSLLAWAEAGREAWHIEATEAVLRERQSDPDPGTRAVAYWFLQEDVPSVELRALLDDQDLPAWARARLHALLADRAMQPPEPTDEVIVEDPGDRAQAECLASTDQANLGIGDDPFVGADVRLTAPWVLAHETLGEVEDHLAEARQAVAALPEGSRRVVRERRLQALTLAGTERAAVESDDEHTLDVLRAELARAEEMLDGESMSRSIAWLAVAMGSSNLVLDEPLEAGAIARRAIAAARGIDDHVIAAANLILADVLGVTEGPAAAVSAQRQAIAAMAPGPPPARSIRRGRALSVLGGQLMSSGRADDATVAFAEASADFDAAGLPLMAVGLIVQRAEAELAVGEPEGAHRLAVAALERLAEIDDPARDHVVIGATEAAARAAMADDRYEEAVGRWLRVANLSAELGLTGGHAQVEAAKAMVLTGDGDGALRLLDEVAAADTEERGVEDGVLAWTRAQVLAQVGRFEEAAESAEVAAAEAEITDDWSSGGWAHLLAGDAWRDSGDTDRALVRFERARELGSLAGDVELESRALAWLADIASEQGRPDDATALTRAMEALWE